MEHDAKALMDSSKAQVISPISAWNNIQLENQSGCFRFPGLVPTLSEDFNQLFAVMLIDMCADPRTVFIDFQAFLAYSNRCEQAVDLWKISFLMFLKMMTIPATR